MLFSTWLTTRLRAHKRHVRQAQAQRQRSDMDAGLYQVDRLEDRTLLSAPGETDLAISKTSSVVAVEQGSEHSYSVSVSNDGSEAATDVLVEDDPSAFLDGITWVAVLNGGASGTTAGSGPLNELVNLPAGSSIDYVITGTVKETARDNITNVATVSSASITDTDPTNNSAFDSDVIVLSSAWGSGDFVNSGQALGAVSTHDVELGDLDGDGDLDIVFGNTSNPNEIWFNDGQGVFTKSGQTLPSGTGVALGDLDGDGDLDIFNTSGTTATAPDTVWLNNGNGVFTSTGQNLGNLISRAVKLGDVDGDGDLDAFVSTFDSTIGNLVYLNDGTGLFTDSGQSLEVDATGNRWGIELGDVDGDGDLDVVMTTLTSGGSNTVYANNGAGVFTKLSDLTIPGGFAASVNLGDLDGDGDLDLFLSRYVHGHVVMLNDGAGNFTLSQEIAVESNWSWEGDLADLDNDGDLDVIFTGAIGTVVAPWFNDGTGNFVESSQRLGTGATLGLAIGDLDGDLDLDVVFAKHDNLPNQVWFNYTEPLQYAEDFEDDTADDLAHVGESRWGTYTDSGDKVYIFNGRNDFGLGVAYYDTASSLPPRYEIVSKVESFVTAGVGFNAFLIFDYQGPDDFKYAGMFADENEWVIGHYQGDWDNRIAEVDVDDVGGSINTNQEYTLFAKIDQDHVKLYVDGVLQVEGTFASGIHNGSAGIATDNGWTAFDDLEIAESVSYGKPAEVPFMEDFSDGFADFFQYNDERFWKVVAPAGDELLRVNTSYNDLLAIAYVPLITGEVPANFNVSVDVRSLPGNAGWHNGYIIFDYKDDGDFKYAGFDADTNEWVIGHYQGDWSNRLAVVDWDDSSRTIDQKVWYSLDVNVSGSIVELTVDDEFITQADFGVALNQGPVGLASDRAFNWYDNFAIEESLPVVAPQYSPTDPLFANWDEEQDELII